MNKVFKVIWSKTKNCYIVASELAKSHTKAPSMKGVSKTLVCGVLACVLGMGISHNAFAYELLPSDTPSYTTSDLPAGTSVYSVNTLYLNGANNTDNATYFNDILTQVGESPSNYYKVNILQRVNLDNSISYFLEFEGSGQTPSVFVGLSDEETQNIFNNPNLNDIDITQTAITFNDSLKYVNQKRLDTVVLGKGANTNFDTVGAVSIGSNSSVTGQNSVALGAGSIAPIDNVVSVGASNNKRRIINVADGVNNSDVATVGQLRDAISATGGIHGVGIANISENATNYNGEGAIGYDSVAIGDAKAAGAGSVAVGSQALTTGTNSIAIGTYATATGDGTTREEINAILANNQAIRDTLNDARAEYTQSQAEYDREKEIFDGQNEAVARVNHANELINGYQAEIDNTLQPNADAANDAYNQAKDAFDTLKNDLENRLSAIKYIDFSLYENTQGEFNLQEAASQLKSQTETGTTFDLPQSFYEDYITNYIRAEGDLRNNKIFATEKANYNKTTSDYNYIGTGNNRVQYGKVTVRLSGSDTGSGGIIIIDDPIDIGGGGSSSGPTNFYDFLKATGSIDDDAHKQMYNSLAGSISGSFVKETDKANLIAHGHNPDEINSITTHLTVVMPTDTGLTGYSGTPKSILTIFDNQGTGYDGLISDTGYKAYFQTTVLTDEQYQAKINTLNSQKNNAISKLAEFQASWEDTAYIQNNPTAAAELQAQVAAIGPILDNRYNVIKSIYDVAHEQYLYEYYRDAGNQTEALRHLGLKENAREFVINGYFGGNENAFNTWLNGYSDTVSVGRNSTYCIMGSPTSYFTFTKYIGNESVQWAYDNIANVEDATEVALRTLNENLDSQLADLENALAQATTDKRNADRALENKQNQINQAQPSQEDLDAAAQAEQTAQDLAQKEAKLQADEEALEQAKANLQNLETIATGGESAIAIGGNAVTTGLNGIGIGTDALVTGEEAIGIGKNAIASGKNSIAIGTDNSVSTNNSIAIGTNNGVTGLNSIAIGNNNVISGQNSVAIGNNLSVTEDNVVLIGTRRVTGVADGTSATDAATVGQTFELVAGSGMTVEEDGVNAIGQKKYKLNSTATGGTTYVSGDNIVIEDDVISAQGLIKYDGADKQTASLEGARGTKLTNLKQATLTRTSTDAVIGAQLFATNTNIEGFANDIRTNSTNISNLNLGLTSVSSAVAANSVTIDTLDDTKADKNLTNLTDIGRQVISAAAANAVQEYIALNGGAGTNSSNNGALGQNLLGGMNTLSAPRAMGFGLMVNPVDDDIVVTNNDLLGDGNDISMEVQAALDDKANISLDNINEAGISVIRDAVANDLNQKADKDTVYTKDETDGLLDAKADLSYVDTALAEKADLSYVDGELSLKADKANVYTKSEANELLNAKADISYVDAGLEAKADKDAVYTKEETNSFLNQKADKSALNAKANADASNIDVEAWSKTLATGQVLPGDTGLVNGGTVFNSMMAVAQSNPVQAGEDTIFIGKQDKFDDIRTIDVSNSKGESRVMTGVITNPQDATSVANVGYVNAIGENIMGNINGRFSEINGKISDVGANAAAMSALVPMPNEGDEKWALSAAVGHYDSSTASAVGLFYKPSDKVIVNVKGTVGSDKNMLAGGVTVALDKGSVPGVTKAQMVKTINDQANRIAQLEQVVNQLVQEKAQK